NRDLPTAIAEGTFREDLYYRLNVIPVRLPPLRDRLSDIPELTAHFLAQLRVRHGLESPVLTEDAITAMQRYHWPGNVRELANLCERLAILYPGRTVDASIVNTLLGATGTPGEDDAARSLAERLDAFERRIITREIEAAGGSIAEAARRVQSDPASLCRRMRRLGLDRGAGITPRHWRCSCWRLHRQPRSMRRSPHPSCRTRRPCARSTRTTQRTSAWSVHPTLRSGRRSRGALRCSTGPCA